MESDDHAARPARRTAVSVPLVLFVATCVSVLWTGSVYALGRPPESLEEAGTGWIYAVPLMAILTCHELGHYVAARIHGVPASLPHFLPLPLVSPFGTLGAVISMPERIRSRNALLDVGAAGPIAGMVVAVPVLVIGLAASEVTPLGPEYAQEGQSLFYWALKRVVVGPIPDGFDVQLHPTAFAGWAGLFVTMINLVPWGQLDGGHVAFALLGPKHHRVARLVRRALLAIFVYNLAKFTLPIALGTSHMPLSLAVGNSLPWLVWYALLGLLGRFMGHEHPPCEGGKLSRARRAVALSCLLWFGLLFMPTPMAHYAEDEPAPGEPAPGAANLRPSASQTTSGA